MLDYRRPVRVFRNLKHGCYSIMQDGRVCASARQVSLAEVEFRVRASGRDRMRRERRKNVHAFAVGSLLDFVHPSEAPRLALPGRTAFYDPYRFDAFVDAESLAPLAGAARVLLDEGGVVRWSDGLHTPVGPALPRAA